MATLWEITINWGTLTIGFKSEGRRVSIQGGPTLTREPIPLPDLLKVKEIEVVTLVWDLGQIEWEGETKEGKQLTQE